MLSAKCLNELKANVKDDIVSFSRIRAAYVSEGKILTEFNKSFLTMPEEEQFKYAAVVKQIFSGKPEEKMLDLEDTYEGTSIYNLWNAGLEDDEAVESFYEGLIPHYDTLGRYLIILVEDNYDVVKVNAAGEAIDESEETYHYIVCAICPVKLSDPGIECKDNLIGLRERDWVMAKPSIGMVYPAFKDRSADRESVMYYASNPKETFPTVMTEFLLTDIRYTIEQRKEQLEDILKMYLIDLFDSEQLEVVIDGVNEKLSNYIGDEEIVDNMCRMLTADNLAQMLRKLGIPELQVKKVSTRYEEAVGSERAIFFVNKKRAARYKAYVSHKRQRELLDRAKCELDAAGQKDLAEEIENYMEKTR